MASLEKRLAALLDLPGNESCSECDRPDNKPSWASFFHCPVDNRRLGVLCCPKCHHLHQQVGEGEFLLKGLRDVEDFNEKDLDDLELSGNKLVNAAYEAAVTNEKDGRDNRQYGYEAYFFEKMMNLSYFNDGVYKELIRASLKAQVEKATKSFYSNQEAEEKKEDDQRRSDRDRGVKRNSSSSSTKELLDREDRRRDRDRDDRDGDRNDRDRSRDRDERRDRRDRDERREIKRSTSSGSTSDLLGREDKSRDRDREDRRRDDKHRDDRRRDEKSRSPRREDDLRRSDHKSKSSHHRSSKVYDDDRKSSRRSRSSKNLEDNDDDRKSSRRSRSSKNLEDDDRKSTRRRSKSSHRRYSGDHTKRERSSSKGRLDYNRKSSSNSDKENIDDSDERRTRESTDEHRRPDAPVRTSSRDEPPVRPSNRDDAQFRSSGGGVQEERRSSRDLPEYRASSREVSPVRDSSRDMSPVGRNSSRDLPRTSSWDIPGLEDDEQDLRFKNEGRTGSTPNLHDAQTSSHGSRSDLRGSRSSSDLRGSRSSSDLRANSSHGRSVMESRGSRSDLTADGKDRMRERRIGRKKSSSGPKRSSSRGNYSRSSSDLGERDDFAHGDDDRISRRGKRSVPRTASSSRRSQRTSAVEPDAVTPTKKDVRGEAHDFIQADRKTSENQETLDALKASAPKPPTTEHQKTIEALKASAPPNAELLMHQKRIEALMKTAPNLKPEIVDALIATAPQHLHAELTAAINKPKLEPPKPGATADHKSTLAALRASAPTKTSEDNADRRILSTLEALKASAPVRDSLQIGALSTPSQTPSTSAVALQTSRPNLTASNLLGALEREDTNQKANQKAGNLNASLSGNLTTGILRKYSSGTPGNDIAVAQSRPSIARTSSDRNLNPRACPENRRSSLSRTGSAMDLMSEGAMTPKLSITSGAGESKTINKAPKKKSSAWDILKGRRADFIRIAQEELAEREAAGNNVAPDPTGDNEVTFGRRTRRIRRGGQRKPPPRSASGQAPRAPSAVSPKKTKKTGTAWDILKSRRADFIKIAQQELAEREAEGNKLSPDETGETGATFGQRPRVRPSARNKAAQAAAQSAAPAPAKTPKKTGTGWDFLKRSRADFIKLAQEEAAEREAAGNTVAPDPTGDNEITFGRRRGLVKRGSVRNLAQKQNPREGAMQQRRGLQRGASFSMRQGRSPSRGLLDAEPEQQSSGPPRRGLQRGPSNRGLVRRGSCGNLGIEEEDRTQPRQLPSRGLVRRGSCGNLGADDAAPLPPTQLQRESSAPLNTRPCYSGSSNAEVLYSKPAPGLQKLGFGKASMPAQADLRQAQDFPGVSAAASRPATSAPPSIPPEAAQAPAEDTTTTSKRGADYYKQKLNAAKDDNDKSILSAKKRQERRAAVPTACA